MQSPVSRIVQSLGEPFPRSGRHDPRIAPGLIRDRLAVRPDRAPNMPLDVERLGESRAIVDIKDDFLILFEDLPWLRRDAGSAVEGPGHALVEQGGQFKL